METGNMSFVSVVIPCYNAEHFIGETIQSVLRQTRPVNEVIVVDDGSTDDSARTAESFGHPVRVVRQSNKGECGARNRGIKEAKGNMIAFVDADDLWHPEKIQLQLAYLDKHPEVGAVITSVALFADHIQNRRIFLQLEDEAVRKLKPIDFLVHWWANQSALMIRSEVASTVLYPEGITDSGDMIHSVELRMKTVIGAVPEFLAFYRRHPKQVTNRADHYLRSIKFRTKWALENYERFGASSAAEAIVPVLRPAAENAADFYWERNLAEFKRLRNELLNLWPEEVSPPKELTRFLFPRFVLLLRDKIGKLTNSSSRLRNDSSSAGQLQHQSSLGYLSRSGLDKYGINVDL